MHELLQASIDALEQPRFSSMFVRFLALQRYDLTPYQSVFGALDVGVQPDLTRVTVGGDAVSGEQLATRFVDFLSRASHRGRLLELAESFWHAFPDAAGDAGPLEYVRARRVLADDFELRCMMPMLSAPLSALSPRRIVDFGCGANRLGLAIQATLQRAGLPAPTVIGVDVYLPEGAHVDPAHGLYLHDLRSQALDAVVHEPVDLIIFKYVLHHMARAEQEVALATVGSVLAPGGRVIILEASVDTSDHDLLQFEATQCDHESWPAEEWANPYRRVSREFYQASGREQRLLLCLEDLFGHVLLPGPAAIPLRMPLPFSYVGRDEITHLAAKGGLRPDLQLSAVLGMPPTLKHGPPSSRFVFRLAA